MKTSLIVGSGLVLLIAYLYKQITDGESFLHFHVRGLLGIRTVAEFLVDQEIGREQDIPEFVYECPSNMTNRVFYSDLFGQYQPCIFKEYYHQIEYEVLNDETLLQLRKPVHLEKNFEFIERVAFKAEYRSVLQNIDREQFICSFKGRISLSILTGYQSLLTDFGMDGLPINESPLDIIEPDLDAHPQLNVAIIFPVELFPGDCLYLPAYYWFQIDSSSEESLGLMFQYEVGSEWQKLVFEALFQRII